MKRKWHDLALARSGWLALALSVSAVSVWSACRDDDGCGDEQDPPLSVLDDTPRPSLCASDSILLTPGELVFTLGSGDGGAASVTVAIDDGGSDLIATSDDAGLDGGAAEGGSSSQGTTGTGSSTDQGGVASAVAGEEVEMAVEARRITGQPRSTATVFISTQQNVAVKLAPRAGVASTTAGECERVSDARLRCILDSNGTARFRVSTPRDAVNGTRGIIRAESGSRYTTALVQVGSAAEDFDQLAIRFDSARLTTIPPPLECGSSPRSTLSCASVVARDVFVDVLRLDADLVDAGDRAGVSDAGDAAAANPHYAALNAPVRVGISLTTSGLATAWLSTADCGKSVGAGALTVEVDPQTLRHPPVRLCSDGAAGTVSVIARADALRGPVVAVSPTSDLQAVPAAVRIVSNADAGNATYDFTVLDCMGGPVAGAILTLDQSAKEYQADARGRSSFELTRADAGAVNNALSVRNSALSGASASCTAIVGGAAQ